MNQNNSAQLANKKHVLVSLLAITFAAAVIGFAIQGLKTAKKQQIDPNTLRGEQAYRFELKTLRTQFAEANTSPTTVSLTSFLGKPLVLNFWASWCTSCRKEAATLEAFWQKHQKEISVLGVAVHDDPADSEAFAQHLGKTYQLAVDNDGSTAIEYGVTGVPETIFINPQGIIVGKKLGPIEQKDLDRFLAEHAHKQQPPTQNSH